MSKKIFIGMLTAAQIAFLHSGGHAIEAFAASEPQQLVATLKTTSIGATVTADIKTLMDAKMTGAQKFEQVVANTVPLIASYAAAGPAALVVDAEAVARELVQSLFNDVIGAVSAAITGGAASATASATSAPALASTGAATLTKLATPPITPAAALAGSATAIG